MKELVLLVVAGPTAAGKTWLGAKLAERLGGEVISADAFAVYRGMDIGTAKPDASLRTLVPHHLLDVADPRERYSAGRFLKEADAVIADCWARGKQPVVVGGTLFYVSSLLYGLFPEPPKDENLRRQLVRQWQADPEPLRQQLRQLDPVLASRLSPNDKQRILRALEVCLVSGRPMSELWAHHPIDAPRYRFLFLALFPPRALLHDRIAKRVEDMWRRGLLLEAERLLDAGVPGEAHAFSAIGYQQALGVLSGKLTVAQAKEQTTVATRQLAKRQFSWLRREQSCQILTGFGDEVLDQALAAWEASVGK